MVDLHSRPRRDPSGNALLLYMAVIIVYNRKRQRSATFSGDFLRIKSPLCFCSFAVLSLLCSVHCSSVLCGI